ncbi:MFS general substrate transporter [Mollisia scopiformis]|uniref:MFS general substrate transporter n=1 Tax=Mollisia scopiformis TaxID=149040 RepID=A0A194X2J9_MOLSC|nr:MFS general substrate transporter [Mollisia scopiformis]KUJ14067.1 MFS general substrate transporter [Mollisia scopiformis]
MLIVIGISRFGVPLMLNSFPVYLPGLLSSLDIAADLVPYYVGICSSIWSITTCITSPFWGRCSDSYGRKPAILLSNILFLFSVLLFGFAGKLWLILAVMGFLGFAGGMTPVLHTTVAELVTQKELQPMAFSLIPLMWTIASMVGPLVGGFLADPTARYPSIFGENQFFMKFPYSLLNIVVAIPFFIGCVVGFLFLKVCYLNRMKLVGEATDICTGNFGRKASSVQQSLPNLFLLEIFTQQSVLSLIYICFLQTHSKLFDEFLPTYMQAVPSPTEPTPPTYQSSALVDFTIFPGGLSFTSHTAALYLTAYGLSAILIQLLIFPRLAPSLGPIRCLRIASSVYPFVYFLTPYLSVLSETPVLRGICTVVLLAMKAGCGIFAFPSSRILLCNSATKGGLGTLNGISSSSQQLMRAIVAVGVGKLFSLGLQNGIIVLPWWTLSFVSMGGLGTVVWLRDEREGGGSIGSEERTSGS